MYKSLVFFSDHNAIFECYLYGGGRCYAFVLFSENFIKYPMKIILYTILFQCSWLQKKKKLYLTLEVLKCVNGLYKHKMILVRTQKHFQFFRNADSCPLCRVAAAIMWIYHLLRQVQWVTIFSWQTYLEKSILKKSKSQFEGILEWLNLYLPFFMGDTEYWVNFHCGIIGYNWVIKWIKDSISILLWINIVRVCPTQYGLRGDFWLPNVCRH